MRLVVMLSVVLSLPLRTADAQSDSTRSSTLATLSGLVTDSAGFPLANATVTIDALRLTSRAGDRGEYRLTAIPLGTHLITARAIGYEPSTLTIDFPAVAERTRTFSLRLTRTTLDSVEVKAKRIDPRMEEFEEHRRLGLGHFLTSEDLRKSEGQRLSSLLAMVPGLGLVSGRANQAWILSKRYSGPLRSTRCEPWDGRNMGRPASGGSIFIPSRGELSMGITCACYAQVYLDGQLINPGMPSDPFDVSSIRHTRSKPSSTTQARRRPRPGIRVSTHHAVCTSCIRGDRKATSVGGASVGTHRVRANGPEACRLGAVLVCPYRRRCYQR